MCLCAVAYLPCQVEAFTPDWQCANTDTRCIVHANILVKAVLILLTCKQSVNHKVIRQPIQGTKKLLF